MARLVSQAFKAAHNSPLSGHSGNVLPLPGGVGGSGAGMIGAYVGFLVGASLVTLAVLGYRTVSYRLQTVPEQPLIRGWAATPGKP